MTPKDSGADGEKIDLRNLPMNDYDLDDLKMAWRRYAHILKDRGEKTFYNALLKRDPLPQPNNVYLLEVDNQVQVDAINLRISDLIEYLRKELRNYSVEIKLSITDNPDEEVKFQTGKDKFAAMARKNPNLHTLKKTFNLDIEF